jgi:hypothetical protein
MMTIRQRAGASIAAAALVGGLTSMLGATHAVGADRGHRHHADPTSTSLAARPDSVGPAPTAIGSVSLRR